MNAHFRIPAGWDLPCLWALLLVGCVIDAWLLVLIVRSVLALVGLR